MPPIGPGCDFGAPGLERGTHLGTFPGTGYNISNTRKLQVFKQPFKIIHGEIAFKNTVRYVNEQTVTPCVPYLAYVPGSVRFSS